MTFLSAAFLLALPLVAVPVAIHLYRGRQRDVIPWGAMQFLESAVTKGRSMERFEELLLMALRLLAVAALIFAVAQPLVRSSWLGMGADREVVLILDNSLSMSREIGGRSAGTQVKEEAIKLLDSLTGSDDVQILLAVGGEWATRESIAADAAGRVQLVELIQAVEPSLGRADLLASLQSAIQLESPHELLGRRIVVFTDSQSLSWRSGDVVAWEQLAAARETAKFPIQVEVRELGAAEGEFHNLAVMELKATPSVVRPAEPIEVVATLKNVGERPGSETTAQWLVGEKVVGESPVDAIAPQSDTQITHTFRIEDAGVFVISCRLLGSDQIELDQESGLVVEVADRIPVLFVHAAEDGGQSLSAAEIFSTALGFRGGVAGEWHSVYQPELATPAGLAELAFGDYRAIVINGSLELDRSVIDRLHAFVRAGGGLWLALGEGVDRDAFNRDWFVEGGGISPLPLGSLEVLGNNEEIAATIHPPTREHVATLQLANTTQLDIDEARIRERWRFGKQPATAEAVSSLLESGDGAPLVVENYVGQGRVLVQALPLGLEWSNLPVLKAYVVMIQDWLDYITAPTTARYNLSPGATILARPPAAAAELSAKMITSRGRELPLVASETELGRAYRFSQTAVPGRYRVRFMEGERVSAEIPFYIARDPRESHFETLSAADREVLLAKAGVRFGDVTVGQTPSTADVAPRREPIWGVLLAALVIFLVAEFLLSHRLSQERHGLAVNTG